MMLYILRHAIAVDPSESKSDSERQLTKKGISELKHVGKKLRKRRFSFDTIMTSPYKRAYQTAAIMAQIFKLKSKIILSDALTSGSDPKRIIQELSLRRLTASNVLLVGHEPFLSELISTLLVGDTSLDSDLKKSGFCALEINRLRFAKCATLTHFLSPSDF